MARDKRNGKTNKGTRGAAAYKHFAFDKKLSRGQMKRLRRAMSFAAIPGRLHRHKLTVRLEPDVLSNIHDVLDKSGLEYRISRI